MRLIITFLMGVSMVSAPAAATCAGDEILPAKQALFNVFDSGYNLSEIDTAIPLPSIPLEAQDAAASMPPLDIDVLCYGKGFCVLMPPEDNQNKMPLFALDFMQRFTDYGTPLTTNEKQKTEQALVILSNTAFGQKICKNLTGGNCTIESLAGKGIVLQTRAIMETDYRAKTLVYGGKVLIVTNRQPQWANQNPIFWAQIIGHELSHAEDCKIFKRGLDKLNLDTETKAYLSELAVYNELKARYPRETNDPVMNFLIEVWAWKENGGPYPKDFKYTNGRPQSAKEFIDRIINPSRKGTDAIRNVTAKYFYNENLPYPVPVILNIQYYEFIKNLELRGVEYNKWRINNPGLATPGSQPSQQPQQPQQPTGNNNGDGNGGGQPDDGDGGGGGSGGGGQPFIPNPHFQDYQ